MKLSKLFIASLLSVTLLSCVAHQKKSSDPLPDQAALEATSPTPASGTTPTPSTAPAASGKTEVLDSQTVQDQRIEAALLPNFHQVNANIYRSGRPAQGAMAALAKIGVKSVLSIESYGLDPDDVDDEKAWASAAKLKFFHIPMSGLLKPKVEQIHQALSFLQDPANYPILVHCEKGSDRTGIVVASYHIKNDGWTVEKATSDMYHFGHSQWLSWWDDILNQI